MSSTETIALGLIGFAFFWVVVAVWIFWRKPFFVWWRTVRPRRREIRKKYRAMVNSRRDHLAQIKTAKALPTELKSSWFDANKAPTLDHLSGVNGVGAGTLDILRQNGVKSVSEITSVEQLTHFKGIGQHKASLLVEGLDAVMATWKIELSRQYEEEIYPDQHSALVSAAQSKARMSQEALDAMMLTDLTGIRRQLFRGNVLFWLIAPSDPLIWQDIDERLDHVLSIIGVGGQPKRLTHRMSAVWSSPISKRMSVLVDEHGSEREVWLHVLRTYYSPTEFEVFTAQVWRALNYDVSLTPASGDHGADLIAVQNDERIAIECKRYAANASVGNVHIRGVAAHKSDQQNPATRALLVTTGKFTPKAFEAAEKFGVELIGPKELGQLMFETQTIPDMSRLEGESSL